MWPFKEKIYYTQAQVDKIISECKAEIKLEVSENHRSIADQAHKIMTEVFNGLTKLDDDGKSYDDKKHEMEARYKKMLGVHYHPGHVSDYISWKSNLDGTIEKLINRKIDFINSTRKQVIDSTIEEAIKDEGLLVKLVARIRAHQLKD